ncbi:MAG: substrate-binding domain-containing protein, partial [Bryobacteraceae bacterium]|nr:substrate-binding domain-containing protein [Bryobacteraceae bacterium]
MLSRRAWAGVALSGLVGCGGSKRRTIGVVPKATSHLFFVSIHKGVDKAAQDLGVEVIWNGPGEETDHGRQIQIVDAMVARGVDAIAISATDERALAAPVQRAIARGIPVTIFDSGVNGTGFVSFIATDNYGAGCTAARTLAKLTGDTGTIGMVMHKPGGTSTVLREQGFEATLKQEFPKMRIVARQYGMSDESRSMAVAENMLSANPGLGGIFASSEASSLGAVQALRSRGLGGKVRLVTFDSSKTHVQGLRDGIIDVMLVQDAFRIGYEAVRSLADKLSGHTPAPRLDLP